MTTAAERLAKVIAESPRRDDLSPVVAADLTPLLQRSIEMATSKDAEPITVTPHFNGPEWLAVLGAVEFAANQFNDGNQVRSVLLNARAEMLLARGRTNR